MFKDYKIKYDLTCCEAWCFWAHRLQILKAQANDVTKGFRIIITSLSFFFPRSNLTDPCLTFVVVFRHEHAHLLVHWSGCLDALSALSVSCHTGQIGVMCRWFNLVVVVMVGVTSPWSCFCWESRRSTVQPSVCASSRGARPRY